MARRRSRRLYLPPLIAGRMDRHDEPDRAAGGLRPRRAAHQPRRARRAITTASPARRSSSPMAITIWPRTSSIWCWRALPDAPRRHQRHLAVPRAEIPAGADGAPGERNDLRVRLARAQARHPCQPDLRHGLWRQRRRHRLSRRRGEPRPRLHVHHDEQRPPRASASRAWRIAERAYQAGARLCPRRASRAAPPGAPSRGTRRSSAIPTCGAC